MRTGSVGAMFVAPTVAASVDTVVNVASGRAGHCQVREIVGMPGGVEHVRGCSPTTGRLTGGYIGKGQQPLSVELLAEARQRCACLFGGDLGVDVHGHGDLAVPEYLHGDARVDIERGEQGGACAPGGVRRYLANTCLAAAGLEVAMEVARLDRRAVPRRVEKTRPRSSQAPSAAAGHSSCRVCRSRSAARQISRRASGASDASVFVSR
jgi:hypothetical protein